MAPSRATGRPEFVLSRTCKNDAVMTVCVQGVGAFYSFFGVIGLCIIYFKSKSLLDEIKNHPDNAAPPPPPPGECGWDCAAQENERIKNERQE